MGGGGGGDPAAAARKMEAERQARVKAATDEINRIFNNQVKQTGTRYAPWIQLGSNRQTMTPEEFAAAQEKYNQALAARKDPTAPLDHIDGFNPLLWRKESYDYWVDGDPSKSRQVLYDQQRNAVYDLNRLDVDRQAAEAERANRFGLARAGLLGGSANVDSIGDLDRRTNEGLMRAGGIADQASADLFSADERTRANLISLAQSGIDTGTAAQQALNGLEVNAANAAGARAGATVGDLFGSMSQAYLMNQMRAGQQAGMNPNHGQQWLGVSDTRKGYGGSTS